ncbi:MAG TPA: 2,3-diphosphoglycerate-dependent phosphoglycerate mutase [archaeon]|nr:2,3-diphosphoglycerate-dependent phosphoglycerate mutase [archaeon]
MTKLVLVRHGESLWNLENRFTGWIDIDLSEKGIEECKRCAQILLKNNYKFDTVYTSVLKRAIHSASIILGTMDLRVPIIENWRLNERHYGALAGLNKQEMRKKHGENQVFMWRRSYDIAPPALGKNDPNPAKDPRYKSLKKSEIPLTESLKDTVDRVIPYWKSELAPALKSGKSILICAHGNSIRALIKHIDKISNEEIPKLEIPTGKPLVYEFGKNLKPIKHYYLE